MTTARHLSLGAKGEQLATEWLIKHGYKIVGRNLKLGGVEIDIVAGQGSVIILVEVKTRRSAEFGSPEEAVTATKLRRLSAAAAMYARQNPKVRQIRLDVIALILPLDPVAPKRLRHYRGVGEGEELVSFG